MEGETIVHAICNEIEVRTCKSASLLLLVNSERVQRYRAKFLKVFFSAPQAESFRRGPRGNIPEVRNQVPDRDQIEAREIPAQNFVWTT